eukprot:TRINITY_DN1115_c0_g1_i2.p1 TRINITY_DN1115_c0_g1~~TRINITY_DN1115_c0_g1_i2.p1  ORF type:complete len:566 (+),score=87.42 TRINITY_DN1115_c0_g1_i2:149-1846(+)
MSERPTKKRKLAEDVELNKREVTVHFVGLPSHLASGFKLKTAASSTDEIMEDICKFFGFPLDKADKIISSASSAKSAGKLQLADIIGAAPKVALDYKELSKHIADLDAKIQKVAASYIVSGQSSSVNAWNAKIYKAEEQKTTPEMIYERKSQRFKAVEIKGLPLKFEKQEDRSISIPNELYFKGFVFDTPVLNKFLSGAVFAQSLMEVKAQHDFLQELVVPKAIIQMKIMVLADKSKKFVVVLKPRPLAEKPTLKIYVCHYHDVKGRSLEKLSEVAAQEYKKHLHVILDIDETILFYEDIKDRVPRKALEDKALHPIYEWKVGGHTRRAVLNFAPAIEKFLKEALANGCKLYICTHGSDEYAQFVQEHLTKLLKLNPGGLFTNVVSFQWYLQFYERQPENKDKLKEASKAEAPPADYHGKQIAATIAGTSGIDWKEPYTDTSRVLIFDDKPWVWGPERTDAIPVAAMTLHKTGEKFTRLALLAGLLKQAADGMRKGRSKTFSNSFNHAANTDLQRSPPREGHDDDLPQRLREKCSAAVTGQWGLRLPVLTCAMRRLLEKRKAYKM